MKYLRQVSSFEIVSGGLKTVKKTVNEAKLQKNAFLGFSINFKSKPGPKQVYKREVLLESYTLTTLVGKNQKFLKKDLGRPLLKG